MYILDISTWWESLSGFEQIFWSIALLFSLLFLLQTVLSFIAGDGDEAFGDADASVEHDTGIAYGFFTIKNFIAFFTIFGWTGIALIKGNIAKGPTIVIALLAGLAVVAMMMLLFRLMSRLKESGTLELKNAIGKIGETYLLIPAQRQGAGKIHIKIQGSLRELQAVSDDLAAIPTGKLIRVTGVLDNSILIVTTQLS